MQIGTAVTLAILAYTVRCDTDNIHPLNQEGNCYCGVENNYQNRIIRGEDALPGQFPWMVGLFYGGFLCGGTLVSRRHVLTAAHCVHHIRNPHNLMVTFGRTHQSDMSLRPFVIAVEKIRTHEGWDTRSLANDIAVLVLSAPVNLHENPTVKPVCLPDLVNVAELADAGQTGVVTGWGYTEQGTLADTLQSLTVNILGKRAENCGNYEDYEITDDMLCAGYIDGYFDSCQMDSGGPLTVKDAPENNGATTLLGVVSWGDGCARPNYPGIYADVPYFVQNGWLNDTIGSMETCPPPPSMK